MLKKILCLLMIGMVFSFVGFTDSAEARRLTKEQRQLKKDKRNAVLMEKKLNSVERNMKYIKSAARYLKNAKKYYNKISDSYKSNGKVVELKERMDGYEAQINKTNAGIASQRAMGNRIRQMRWDFDKSVKPHISVLYFLDAGKLNKKDYYYSYKVDRIRKEYDALSGLESQLNSKFTLLLQKQPKYKVSGATVEEIFELVKNRSKYRVRTVDIICSNKLNKQIKYFDNLLFTTKRDNTIAAHWMDDLYGKDKNKDFNIIKEVKPFYQWVGKSIPSDKLDKLRSFKPALRKILEKIADKHEWNSSKYSYENRYMNKVGKKLAKKLNMDLEEIAMTSDSEWKIVKNAFGIPLRKVGYGYVLFEKDGEPFHRGYKASFTRVYNGSRYEPISSMSISRYFTPHED